MASEQGGSFIRNVAEVPWREFPNHFGGALSKPLVMPETAGSRHLDYRISMYQPMAHVARHILPEFRGFQEVLISFAEVANLQIRQPQPMQHPGLVRLRLGRRIWHEPPEHFGILALRLFEGPAPE